MAVDGRQKAIFAGTTEVYDLGADPGEDEDARFGRQPAGSDAEGAGRLPGAVDRVGARAGQPVGRSAAKPRQPRLRQRQRAAGRPQGRAAADRHGRHLSTSSNSASTLFVQARYAEAIPLFEKILAADAFNLDAALRLATSHSTLGQDAKAVAAFRRAAEIAPRSPDVSALPRAALRARAGNGPARSRSSSRSSPTRRIACLPSRRWRAIREKQGRTMRRDGAAAARHVLRTPGRRRLRRARPAGDGVAADAAGDRVLREGAQPDPGASFRHDLELGVLYLARALSRGARDALDRIPSAHPDYPMALFKRAQVSVLLKEPDSAARIAAGARRRRRVRRAS